MKNIDRFNLIDQIGRELQSRMTYSDIDIYLKGFGIDSRAKTEDKSYSSKWVYSKDILAGESDDVILSIADELELDHPYSSSKRVDLADRSKWGQSLNYELTFDN
ncbi:MAG: hypothetical protein WAL93_00025 [Desulfobacterales bacterium]